MNLSNILFSNLTQKLKLPELHNEKLYIKNLYNQIENLKYEKKKNYKKLDTTFNQIKSIKQNLTVYYIVNISFLRTNTTIHLLNAKGNTKLFYSAGNLGFKGKQKSNRKITTLKLITTLAKKASFIHKKPIAIHLNNVKFYRKLILQKLKQNFFVKVIKSFNLTPYNGCRKRKIRRKKYIKALK